LIRVVVDTNVLVSGLLSENGPPGQIVDLIIAAELQPLLDRRILSEYTRVLRRPELDLPAEAVTQLLHAIDDTGMLITPMPWPHKLPDASDEPFLAVAQAGVALSLVTGNLKHYPERFRQGVQVLSPREFIELLRKQ
jgi:putative PIN family toxin of toxin-antitoxin system